MTVHVSPDVADSCVSACSTFRDRITQCVDNEFHYEQPFSEGSFSTARQIGTVYSLFAGEDLESLLRGFVDQADAMSVLFAAAGGLIDAQDEAVAEALGKATQDPPPMASLGLMGSLAPVTGMLDAGESAAPGYSRVGPEDVSATPLERIVAGAQALDEAQFAAVKSHVTTAAETLEEAAGQLRSDLGAILGTEWQGQFADSAAVPIEGLTRSAYDLAAVLRDVESKATAAEHGFGRTRQDISSEAAALTLTQQVASVEQAPGTTSLRERAEAERAAAEEQARAIMNTVYSPAVMDANLDGLDFPTAYRVVASSALGGPNGMDLAKIWNEDGVIRPASPGVPSASAIADASGAGASGSGSPLNGSAGGSVPTDALTEQALLASRSGGVDVAGVGAGGGAAGSSGAATGASGTVGAANGAVNAGTVAASAPMMATAGTAGGPGVTASGGRGAARSAGAGTATGAGRPGVETGGSAGAGTGSGSGVGSGATASRMGGAGTLSGYGAPSAGVHGGSLATSSGGGRTPLPGSAGTAPGATGGRVGGVPMGMMGAAGAGGQNTRREGHLPASYLVNATNTSELLGPPVKVSPGTIGARTSRGDGPEPGEGTSGPSGSEPGIIAEAARRGVSPAQALVDKLRGR